jgi:uncharacterized protein (UPF0332 family)
MNAVKKEIEVASEMFRDAELMYKELKSAVNRAYYTMFHATKAALLLQGTDCQSHAGAINRFGEYIVKKGLADPRFAKSLRNAYRLREKSDYSVFFEIDKEDVEKLIEEAREFLDVIKKLVHV